MSGQRPLRVCHLAYTFYENDNRVLRYAETLAAEGHDVDVIALRRAGQPLHSAIGSVRLHRIQHRSVTERAAGSYLVKLLWFLVKSSAYLTLLQFRGRHDIVHVHNVPDFLVFAALVPKLLGARVILDIHDILPELYAGKFGTTGGSRAFRTLLQVERLSCRFADWVIVANHLWHERLIARAASPDTCTAIMNYPDLRLFRPATKNRNGGTERFVILYPGTLNHHQGLDLAVRAFASVRQRMPGAELHIYGEGPARPELEDLIGELGLTERVRLSGRQPIDRIATVMADASVGIVPKRADGFGNEAFSTKTLEFMACGVPVIVARTKVDAFYFNDSVVRFFEPGDEQDLAKALLYVYEHRTEHAAWIASAREFALRHSWQERVGDYRDIVGRLAAQRSKAQEVAG